jgi:hypothetical protein
LQQARQPHLTNQAAAAVTKRGQLAEEIVLLRSKRMAARRLEDSPHRKNDDDGRPMFEVIVSESLCDMAAVQPLPAGSAIKVGWTNQGLSGTPVSTGDGVRHLPRLRDWGG